MKKKRFVIALLIVFAAFSALSITVNCLSPIDRVFLDKTSLSLNVGDSYSLTAYLSDGSVSVNSVDFSSSDEKIATVYSGNVTAVSPGEALITVKVNGTNAKDVCKVTVKKSTSDTSEITLTPTSSEVNVGNHIYIKISNNKNNEKVSFTSSDEKIATVSNGIVKGISPGKVTISANIGELKKSLKITVNPAVQGIFELSSYSKSVYKKQSYRISTKNSTGSITWSSSDESIATVKSGYIDAVNTGVAIITAEDSNGNFRTCAITVNGLAPIKFLYSTPNMGALNKNVELTAITDNTRTNLRFKINDNGTEKIVYAENSKADASTVIWTANYSFSKPGLYEIVAESYKNETWSSGRQGSFNVLISKNSDLSVETLETRRVSTELAEMIASFEGFSPTIYDDKLAPGNLTLAYGKVIKTNELYYENITEREGFAYLLDTINNDGYGNYVNEFLINNGIKFNQQQFDALVCFTYNLGNGWMYNSDLKNVILNQSISSGDSQNNNESNILTVNSGNGLNIRSGPGTSYDIVETVADKASLILLEKELIENEWYHVKTASGKEGYCFSKYVSFYTGNQGEKALSNIPADAFVNEILQWNMSSGLHIKGLLYRRIDEAEMFLYGDYIRDGASNKYNFKLPSWYKG